MHREVNPQVYAKAGGILYLLIIVIGFTEEFFIRGRVKVAGDAAATFANLEQMEMLWRTGIALELVMVILTIALAIVKGVGIERWRPLAAVPAT